MGNPAEKTIRNPNLNRLLFKMRTGVNKNFILQQNLFRELPTIIQLYNIVCRQCICITNLWES